MGEQVRGPLGERIGKKSRQRRDRGPTQERRGSYRGKKGIRKKKVAEGSSGGRSSDSRHSDAT